MSDRTEQIERLQDLRLRLFILQREEEMLLEEMVLLLHNGGSSPRQIGKTAEMDPDRVRRILRRNNLTPNTDLDHNNVQRLELYKKGLSDAEIARITGYAEVSIQQWRKRNNLEKNISLRNRKVIDNAV